MYSVHFIWDALDTIAPSKLLASLMALRFIFAETLMCREEMRNVRINLTFSRQKAENWTCSSPPACLCNQHPEGGWL